MNHWPIATVEQSAQLTTLAMEAGLNGRPMPKVKCFFLPGQLLHFNTVYEEARRLRRGGDAEGEMATPINPDSPKAGALAMTQQVEIEPPWEPLGSCFLYSEDLNPIRI